MAGVGHNSVDNVMENAFRRAGAKVGDVRLMVSATRALQESCMNGNAAASMFVAVVYTDDELLAALVRRQMTEQDCAKLAEGYLEQVASDMRGAVGGEGHSERDSHANDALATPTQIGGNADADGMGHSVGDYLQIYAHPSALNTEIPAALRQVRPAGHEPDVPQTRYTGGHPIPATSSETAIGGGQKERDSRRDSASPSTHPACNGGGSDHLEGETQSSNVRPNLFPGHARRGISAMASVQGAIARSLLDTFMVNGRPVGDVTVEEADAWSASRERDARFVKMLIHGLPHGAVIRTHITEDEAKRIWSKAQNAPALGAPLVEAHSPADYREVTHA